MASGCQRDEWKARRAAIARELDWLYSQRLWRDVHPQLRQLRRQLTCSAAEGWPRLVGGYRWTEQLSGQT
jgi:hypothetical protein